MTVASDLVALHRWMRPVLRRRSNREHQFKVRDAVKGDALPDVDSGDPQMAVMLAQMGAQVVGTDMSQGTTILHHAVDGLERVLGRQVIGANRESLRIFSGPMNPGPVLWGEVDLVGRYVPDLVIRSYFFPGRFDRLMLVRYNCERSPVLLGGIVADMTTLDWLLMVPPDFKRRTSASVLSGHAARND